MTGIFCVFALCSIPVSYKLLPGSDFVAPPIFAHVLLLVLTVVYRLDYFWLGVLSFVLVGGVVTLAINSMMKRPLPVHVTNDKTKAKGFTKKNLPENIDVIVIGSGLGGLTCAA